MPTSSSAAFFCMPCRTAFIAFATTASSPMAAAATTSPFVGTCWPAGRPTPDSASPRDNWRSPISNAAYFTPPGMRQHHAADCNRAARQTTLQPLPLRHLMTLATAAHRRCDRPQTLARKLSPGQQPCRSTSAISTVQRINASNRSRDHANAPPTMPAPLTEACAPARQPMLRMDRERPVITIPIAPEHPRVRLNPGFYEVALIPSPCWCHRVTRPHSTLKYYPSS